MPSQESNQRPVVPSSAEVQTIINSWLAQKIIAQQPTPEAQAAMRASASKLRSFMEKYF